MSKQWEAHYTASIINDNDKLTVHKQMGCSWAAIKMETNYNETIKMELRNREQAEQLHFMLGQLLERGRKEDDESTT